MEQGSLAGKVVVVTGAARGLGREYARHLARQGALVTAADIRDVDETVAEITADGGRALAVTVDVGDEASTAAMAAASAADPSYEETLFTLSSPTTSGRAHPVQSRALRGLFTALMV
ncbi:MAG: SDR family NAD(P)-dependent oxidoreductase, partial [Pseudomonadota bacterium]|nr:SDR family NAD(P)-dependent oxidoreductase [Pseudomonadota bacterium]MEC8585031.1 SDR family NAD(P)-dependent oxidoreductase [Pseudomonadota bacterium]